MIFLFGFFFKGNILFFCFDCLGVINLWWDMIFLLVLLVLNGGLREGVIDFGLWVGDSDFDFKVIFLWFLGCFGYL